MTRNIIVLGFLYLIVHQINAQSINFDSDNFKDKHKLTEAINDLDTGTILFDNGTAFCKYNLEYQHCEKGYKFYKEAIPYLQKAQDFNNNNAELNFKLGVCYFYSPFKFKALAYFEKAYSLDKSVYYLIDYYLGCCYHLDYQWDKAIKHYKATLDVLKTKKDIKHISQKEVEHRIEQCNNGKALSTQQPLDVTIKNLGSTINTEYPEYGAITIADGNMMLFTSRRDSLFAEEEATENEIEIDENLKNPESIYLSFKTKSAWQQAKKIHYPINKGNEHDAILSVAPDGKSILIYKRGDIFESLFINGKWTDPDAIEGDLNSSFVEASAIYSPDMKTIFFSSDRPESRGGKDIFIGHMNNNGTCTKITSLGKEINTEYNEDGIFLSESGDELYFSSEGHNSIGGYDVFVSKRIDSVTWSKPINLGLPINTPGDDVFFVLNPNRKSGFYTSFKSDGNGEKDLYTLSFSTPYTPFESVKTTAPIVEKQEKKIDTIALHKGLNALPIQGSIFDIDTKTPISANIKITEKNIPDTIRKIQANDGKYTISLYDSSFYKFTISSPGYTTKEEFIKTPVNASSFEITHFLVKEPSIKTSIDTISDIFVESIGKNNSLIEGRIFDFLTDESIAANIKVVDAKTDSVIATAKSDSKNGKFKVVVPSGKEYKIIADANGYLFQSNRLSTWASKPYIQYEDKLFKNNEAILKTNLDSNYATVKYAAFAYIKGILLDSAKKQPMVAAISVYKEGEKEAISSTTSGTDGKYQICVPTGFPYIIEILADGYVPIRKRMNVPIAAKIIELEAQMKLIPSAEKSVKLNNINYASGQYELSPIQQNKLKSIKDYIAGTSVNSINIVGYTDDQGGTELNLRLSKNRAEEVARCIQQFNKNLNIEIEGKGELSPIAPNTTDEGRSQNRRTEIIIKIAN